MPLQVQCYRSSTELDPLVRQLNELLHVLACKTDRQQYKHMRALPNSETHEPEVYGPLPQLLGSAEVIPFLLLTMAARSGRLPCAAADAHAVTEAHQSSSTA